MLKLKIIAEGYFFRSGSVGKKSAAILSTKDPFIYSSYYPKKEKKRNYTKYL
jgi:hypothetical protein